jgi:UrcA family protein
MRHGVSGSRARGLLHLSNRIAGLSTAHALVEAATRLVENATTMRGGHGIPMFAKCHVQEDSMIRSIALSSILLVAAGIAGPAAAQPAARSIAVSTTGLDLTSRIGRDTLATRVDHAVTRICGSLHTRSTNALQNRVACTRQARAQAQIQVADLIAAANNRRLASQTSGPLAH